MAERTFAYMLILVAIAASNPAAHIRPLLDVVKVALSLLGA